MASSEVSGHFARSNSSTNEDQWKSVEDQGPLVRGPVLSKVKAEPTGGIIWEVEGRGSGSKGVLFFSKCFRDGFLPIKN